MPSLGSLAGCKHVQALYDHENIRPVEGDRLVRQDVIGPDASRPGARRLRAAGLHVAQEGKQAWAGRSSPESPSGLISPRSSRIALANRKPSVGTRSTLRMAVPAGEQRLQHPGRGALAHRHAEPASPMMKGSLPSVWFREGSVVAVVQPIAPPPHRNSAAATAADRPRSTSSTETRSVRPPRGSMSASVRVMGVSALKLGPFRLRRTSGRGSSSTAVCARTWARKDAGRLSRGVPFRRGPTRPCASRALGERRRARARGLRAAPIR